MLQETTAFIENINEVHQATGAKSLSKKQIRFLSACICAICWFGKISWASFGRFFLDISAQSYSYMLKRSSIPWGSLWLSAVIFTLNIFRVKKAVISIDDTQRARSNRTKKIFGVFKDFDKKYGGFRFFQNIMMVCLVTDKVTIPLFFAFYRPDPKFTEWKKADKEAKESNKPRPKKPKPKEKYPRRNMIAMKLLEIAIAFTKDKRLKQKLQVRTVVADSAFFCQRNEIIVRKLGLVFISQLKKNQRCKQGSGSETSIEEFFKDRPSKTMTLSVRPRSSQKVEYICEMLHIKRLGKKCHVIAIRYKESCDFRYLNCNDFTWQVKDSISGYSLRS